MDEDLREAARALRGQLPELVGDRADEYDAVLRDLLVRATTEEEEAVDEQFLSLVQGSPVLHEWVASLLSDEHLRPPHAQPSTERGYTPLPGHGAPVDAQRYACPVDGNFVWYRPFIGVPVPTCPDHGTPLVRQDV
jgi:hypothetical protein